MPAGGRGHVSGSHGRERQLHPPKPNRPAGPRYRRRRRASGQRHRPAHDASSAPLQMCTADIVGQRRKADAPRLRLAGYGEPGQQGKRLWHCSSRPACRRSHSRCAKQADHQSGAYRRIPSLKTVRGAIVGNSPAKPTRVIRFRIRPLYGDRLPLSSVGAESPIHTRREGKPCCDQ